MRSTYNSVLTMTTNNSNHFEQSIYFHLVIHGVISSVEAIILLLVYCIWNFALNFCYRWTIVEHTLQRQEFLFNTKRCVIQTICGQLFRCPAHLWYNPFDKRAEKYFPCAINEVWIFVHGVIEGRKLKHISSYLSLQKPNDLLQRFIKLNGMNAAI